jgi:dynein heavy chain
VHPPPPLCRPEAFGQHPNADISYLIEDSKALLGGLSSLTPRTGSSSSTADSGGGAAGSGSGSSGSGRQEELVEALANDLLDQVCAFGCVCCVLCGVLLCVS